MPLFACFAPLREAAVVAFKPRGPARAPASEAQFMGLCPAQAGYSLALPGRGTVPPATLPLFVQVAAATVWLLVAPNARSTSDVRRGGLTRNMGACRRATPAHRAGPTNGQGR